MSFPQTTHTSIVLRSWQELERVLNEHSTNGATVAVDGRSLTLAEVVAVSRYHTQAHLDPAAVVGLEKSNEALLQRISEGESIYGVNTGFGASAYLRISTGAALQRILTRELSYGILPPGGRDHVPGGSDASLQLHRDDFSGSDEVGAQHMPWTWVRAAVLIRISSLVQGCSGVRSVIVERLLDLLSHDVVPMIPLRGSISASGDLSPLAYISGTLQGKSTIRVLTGDGSDLYADEALKRCGVEPVILGPKEGLAIVNGTAISTAAASMAIHQVNVLAILAQVLTAMSVEGLAGTTESFHPFFSEVRPHIGQAESARNISAFLRGTSLAYTNDGSDGSLRQDRYSIRTAPQWLGPSLEDLALAHRQVMVECNSATDNPLIIPSGTVLHGGNFQAKSVTAAMEKVRQAVQAIGRMLYVQCTEMINPSTSRGLPPNLCATDPTTSGIFKATDIHVSALQAELGFLAGPVNHVQTAELGNQSLNSLALISARYTHTALAVLTELAAAHLLAACQAIDLRAIHKSFITSYRERWSGTLHKCFQDAVSGAGAGAGNKSSLDAPDLEEALWRALLTGMEQTTHMDAAVRFSSVAQYLRTPLLASASFRALPEPLVALDAFEAALSADVEREWTTHRDAYLEHGDARHFLGQGTREMYVFVRKSLGVPLLWTKVIETPTGPGVQRAPTVGSYTSVVYRALKDGAVIPVLRRVLEDAAVPVQDKN